MAWLTLPAAALAVVVCSGCQTSFSASLGDERNNGQYAATNAEATGDNDTPRSVGRPGLVPMARPPIPDLPVPIGFKLVESISRSYESAGARLIDHTYEGRETKYDVDRFYRKQMPLKGWTMRSTQMVRGEHLLRFVKDTELCEVRITSRDAFGGQRTRITFNVQTQGQGEIGPYKEKNNKD
jgi:hypothetical protein